MTSPTATLEDRRAAWAAQQARSLARRQSLRDEAEVDPNGCTNCDDTGWVEAEYARGYDTPCYSCQPYPCNGDCPNGCAHP